MDYDSKTLLLRQRVLEHCRNPQTQSVVMTEIFQSVGMLAQDQYGNYVIQVSNNSLIFI